MSYNGIGLPTPRGTGTSGYIQKNLSSGHSSLNNRHTQYNSYLNKYAARKQLKERNTKSEEKFQKRVNFRSDLQIVEHERKRMVEMECAALRDALEEKNEAWEESGDAEDRKKVRSEEDIEVEVGKLRARLSAELERDPDYLVNAASRGRSKVGAKVANRVSKESIRKNKYDLHAMAKQKEVENERFAKAFRLSDEQEKREAHLDLQNGEKFSYGGTYSREPSDLQPEKNTQKLRRVEYSDEIAKDVDNDAQDESGDAEKAAEYKPYYTSVSRVKHVKKQGSNAGDDADGDSKAAREAKQFLEDIMY